MGRDKPYCEHDGEISGLSLVLNPQQRRSRPIAARKASETRGQRAHAHVATKEKALELFTRKPPFWRLFAFLDPDDDRKRARDGLKRSGAPDRSFPKHHGGVADARDRPAGSLRSHEAGVLRQRAAGVDGSLHRSDAPATRSRSRSGGSFWRVSKARTPEALGVRLLGGRFLCLTRWK